MQLELSEPEDATTHRERAINGLLLVHEAATAAGDIREAIAALEEAGSLVDKEGEPIRWAEVNTPLAHLLLRAGPKRSSRQLHRPT